MKPLYRCIQNTKLNKKGKDREGESIQPVPASMRCCLGAKACYSTETGAGSSPLGTAGAGAEHCWTSRSGKGADNSSISGE